MHKNAKIASITLICLGIELAMGQVSREQARTAYWAKRDRIHAIEKRIFETRPMRRDSPLRAENIRDEEVREIQVVSARIVPKAIVNISGVVTGCPCEEGPSCSDQVWILAHRSGSTVGLQLSKVNNHWTLGAIQRWWLEYEALEARSDKFSSFTAFSDAQDALKEKFPVCLAQSATTVPEAGK